MLKWPSLSVEDQKHSTNNLVWLNQKPYSLRKELIQKNKFPTLHDKGMMEWFNAGGGKLSYVEHGVSSATSSSTTSSMRRLLATESIDKQNHVKKLSF